MTLNILLYLVILFFILYLYTLICKSKNLKMSLILNLLDFFQIFYNILIYIYLLLLYYLFNLQSFLFYIFIIRNTFINLKNIY